MPSPLLRSVGAEWRAKVVDTSPWKATVEERPGGEAQGFWVQCGELRGYLKPSKADAQIDMHPRAAHEKIAADLAFDLGLPVSPAVLVDGIECGGIVKAAVVSLVLYREVHKWGHVTTTTASAAIARHILRVNRAAWSGILAFDTWLANSDRHNDTNLVIGINHESPLAEPIFCDYANSMLHSQWTQGSHGTVALPHLLPAMLELFDRDAAFAVADKIKTFATETISTIVNRIPEDYLLAKHKPILIDALAQRGKVVPDVIASSTKRG
jgi:hypothetical protein